MARAEAHEVAERTARHSGLAARLSALSDGEVLRLLGTGIHRRRGIGGTTRTIELDGLPVFAKELRVTDLEIAAGPGDTRNLFGLPPWYHYGVGEGSTGFNAWREVAAHEMVSDWVERGDSDAFPVLHHWRVLSDRGRRELVEDDIVRAVNFWAGSAEVEARLRALSAATTVVTLFMEHLPLGLPGWLGHQWDSGSTDMASLLEDTTVELLGAAKRMRAGGLVHFDAHLDNVLTTGRRLVVSDFGLALASRFQLDDAERRFLAAHEDHDVAYCAAELTNAILRGVMSFPDLGARNAWLQSSSRRGAFEGLPGAFTGLLALLAPTATVMNDFHWRLHGGELDTPFPASALAATLDVVERW